MSTKSCLRIVLMGLFCVCLGAGCSSTGGDMDEADLILPGGLEEDEFSMGDTRFGEGTRVAGSGFENVQFDYDSFQIRDGELAKIETVAEHMRRNRGLRLVAEGHCDERGSREYNMSLGEHRALAVRAHLIRLGIEGERVQTRSYGEERPLSPGHGESAWRLNRRAEFALYR